MPARPATNDYKVIVARNLFGLRPPPPPSAPPEPEPPPKITLTGITTILGDKEVLMKVQVPSEPRQPPREESLILSEGQRQGGIHVLAINPKTDDVTIDDFGTILTLNLEKDGAKLATQQPPAVAPSFGQVPANRGRPTSQVLTPPFNALRARPAFTPVPQKPDVHSGPSRPTWQGRR